MAGVQEQPRSVRKTGTGGGWWRMENEVVVVWLSHPKKGGCIWLHEKEASKCVRRSATRVVRLYSVTTRVVPRGHEYFFQVKFVPIQQMAYYRHLRVNP